MTSIEEIEKQVMEQDIIPFHNKIYDGFLPESFIEQFKVAMMFIPVTSHQYPMRDVKAMAAKRPDEVTMKEVGQMINAVYAVPFASMYASLEEGIEKTMVFDRIREEYNKNTAAFERKINAKKQRLLKLSGIGGNSAGMNGMQIIPKN